MNIKINSSNEKFFNVYQQTRDEVYFVLIHARLADKVCQFLGRYLSTDRHNLIDGLACAVFAELRGVSARICSVEAWLYSTAERFARAA